jgi:hypothetical protein
MLGAKALIIGSLASAVIITALWYRGSYHAERADALGGQLDRAIEVSNANAEQAKHFADEADRFAVLLLENEQVKDAGRKKSDAVRRDAIAAPPEDDGPIAPVLRRWLDSLPDPAGAGAPGDDPRSTGPAASGFADLRTYAPAHVGDAAERRTAARRLP